jgi:4'-phosphopantetheinyl transferase
MLAVMLEQAAFSRFTHRVAASLRACGFAPPAQGQARVIVFDSAPWWALRNEARDLLSAHEATRAARFRHALDHDTYTIAHAFWRVALGIVLGADPARVNLTRSPDGQPLLPRTGLATSLSHSGTMVAVAIARGDAIGVDIEGFSPRGHLNDIAEVLCTPQESAAMSLLEGEARTRALLDLWTRKEALLKAFGVGLKVTPSSIQAEGDELFAPPDEAPQAAPCRLHALSMPVGWAGSVALSADIESHTLHHV